MLDPVDRVIQAAGDVKGSFEIHTAGGDGGNDVLICPSLAERGLPHGFTLRWRRVKGGVGNPKPFGVPDREDEDRNDLSRVLDLNLVYMRQVHRTEIEVVSQPLDDPPVCDGLLTDREGLGLVVRTADCVPLLMWDEKRNVVAAVHAGWRGTLAGVVPRAVNRLEERFGSQPDNIHVAMGPSIGSCCYEVGDEVVRAFAERFTGWECWFVSGSRQRMHLDLIEANRRQLTDSGVRPERVHATRLCTHCNNELFYSYRREGKGVGRLMGVVGVARIYGSS